MSNLVAYPQPNNTDELSQIAIPVNYSSDQGLAALLASLTVSGKGIAPYIRNITAAQFISGEYDFPAPASYPAAPYKLPILEPKTWGVAGDFIDSYKAVEIYQIGTSAKPMTSSFPILLNNQAFGGINPFEGGQAVKIIIYKQVGTGIVWADSNITNNGQSDAAIRAQNLLVFEVTAIPGQKFQITQWFIPSVIYPAPSGDLSQTYPDVVIAANAITSDKIRDNAVVTAKIATKAVSAVKVADKAIGTGQIADKAVSSGQLADQAVGNTQLALKSVAIGNLNDNLKERVTYIPCFARAIIGAPYYADQSNKVWIQSITHDYSLYTHTWVINLVAGLPIQSGSVIASSAGDFERVYASYISTSNQIMVQAVENGGAQNDAGINISFFIQA